MVNAKTRYIYNIQKFKYVRRGVMVHQLDNFAGVLDLKEKWW